MNYVLDACAVIAFLDGEQGADTVKDLFEKAESGEITVFIHAVNLLEVYYDRLYKAPGLAGEILDKLYASPIIILDTISAALIREAGKMKRLYKPSLADSFALAAALFMHSTLVTADHHDLDAIESQVAIPFLWIR
jgi:predicted nucleic acid-binding protein